MGSDHENRLILQVTLGNLDQVVNPSLDDARAFRFVMQNCMREKDDASLPVSLRHSLRLNLSPAASEGFEWPSQSLRKPRLTDR
jgi:hypothetical protein